LRDQVLAQISWHNERVNSRNQPTLHVSKTDEIYVTEDFEHDSVPCESPKNYIFRSNENSEDLGELKGTF
jgi:hypothetical protein